MLGCIHPNRFRLSGRNRSLQVWRALRHAWAIRSVTSGINRSCLMIGLLDGKHDRETLIDSLRSAFSGGAMMIKSKGEALKDVSGEHLTVILDKTLSRLHSAALIEG